jgi:PAS domain S-box-containing protein
VSRNTVSLRDWDRADAWLGLSAIAAVIVLNVATSLSGGPYVSIVKTAVLMAFLTHPYMLLRVIRHFRDVPRSWEWTLLVVAAAGTFAILLAPSPKPLSVRLITTVYVAFAQVLASVALASTAKRHRGLTAWRLNMAAVGAALLAADFAVLVLATNVSTYGLYVKLLWLQRDLVIAMLVLYFLGLVPPHRLRRWLQRGEEYRFLRRTAERDPDVRGRLAAATLVDAAVRTTVTTSVVVALGDEKLVVRAATRPEWIGLEAAAGLGVGRAITTGGPISDAIDRLESELRPVGAEAVRFLALPIVGGNITWGVLIIMQRRSSLFPKDDVAILERLCRYTGETLDQARLLSEERARQQREADARLDLILESLQDYAVITVNDDGVITSWNSGAEQVFLYPAAEAIGQPAHRLFDDGAPWLSEQLQRVRGGAPANPEAIGRRRDDSRLTTTVVIRPLQTRSGRPSGFVIVMRDVSQRRLLEERLRQAQKLEAIGRLAGGVAHDFNNMLIVILGYTETLDDVVAEEHRGSLEEIRKAAERAASLTKQLLAFSRQQVIRPRVVAPREIVESVVPMLSRLLGAQIVMVQNVDLNTPSILADPAQLEQVIVNLAVNARDAMPQGGRLTISARAVTLSAVDAAGLTGRTGVHALIEVTDTGTGLSEETKAKMFEPFFTTKEVGRGTGLGLAMVYGTVQQINGAITCDSELGRGTTFRIYVPAHVAD